jgi:hypothetical protein
MLSTRQNDFSVGPGSVLPEKGRGRKAIAFLVFRSLSIPQAGFPSIKTAFPLDRARPFVVNSFRFAFSRILTSGAVKNAEVNGL